MKELEQTFEKELNEIINKEADEFVDIEIGDFINALESKHDLIISVLKFHLLSENLLERIVLGTLKRGDRIIEKGNLSYYQKLQLIDSFDLVKDSHIQALRHLNSLRNKCSHKKETKITLEDVDLIGRPLGKEYTTIKRKHKNDLEKIVIDTFVIIYKGILCNVAIIEIIEDITQKFKKTKNIQPDSADEIEPT